MIPINANTKIGTLLKLHPDALETIVSISPKFTKLRNPILRKVIAARTSIAMASKLSGCNIDDFFNKLQPLGFDIDTTTIIEIEKGQDNKPAPDFMKNISADKIFQLDVRPIIETGKDPLNVIMESIKTLKQGFILKIINSFEPTPLILLLSKRGFESYTETISDELVNTYFYNNVNAFMVADNKESDHSAAWDEILKRFAGKTKTVDVRQLEMPLPMHAILEALATLPIDNALFVYHKRIPVFLLPELEEQQFSYRIKEISGAEVHLLIYKD
ncbi:DUF2249 domain-containing protein [Ferruginibacter lapsinanis]|uniref:DUF2249 domain-containing protein n=1 Tax=Ferruginibacter lapsinanis TaxID=563172 RepID=UPI001E6182CB|nr:DUF2249 domain-containing protein [Ferruginibacter lapsinanis]UEG48852.1 DUF2249 domain-containing protein [Ferruginibacter lapsinanis]